MKKYIFIPMIVIMALGGCAQHLNEQDRALLMETHELAVQAKASADQAKASADQAAMDAKTAREDAEKSSERSDRIFQQGQNK